MIPKKIYLNYVDENDDEKTWSEHTVSLVGFDILNREYTDLSQVWHSNQEMPQQDIDEYGCGKDCLIEIKNSHIIEIGQVLFDDDIYAISCHLNTYAMDEIIRWAYIEDLLPNNIANN